MRPSAASSSRSTLVPCGLECTCSAEPSPESVNAPGSRPYLSADGVIVTGSTPLVNIPDYPAEEDLRAELESLPHVIVRDIDAIAREAGNPRGANMALLGMAAQAIGIVSAEQLRTAIATVFGRKGQAVVDANIKAFDCGLEAAKH